MKRTAALLAAVATAGALSATTLAPTPAAAAACPTGWGSLPEKAAPYGGYLTDVRAGQQACYDRLVLDIAGKVEGWDVRYGAVAQDGSGTAVPLRGTDLRIIVHSAAYDGNGAATYDPANDSEAVDVSGYRTFRQVAWAGSFEGQSTVGLTARARLPFRVMVLNGPGSGSRLVVDVAHRW